VPGEHEPVHQLGHHIIGPLLRLFYDLIECE
jgi:hypothetical protein